jgi:hypothetical protein
MAKEKTKFPVKKALSEAELTGFYTVPIEQQASVRELDRSGADLQKALGALRQDYLAKEANILRQFAENRQAYEKTISEVAKNAGIDLQQAAAQRNPWTFDLKNMTFKRAMPPQAPEQEQAVQ